MWDKIKKSFIDGTALLLPISCCVVGTLSCKTSQPKVEMPKPSPIATAAVQQATVMIDSSGFMITATISNIQAAKECFAEGAYIDLARLGPKGFGLNSTFHMVIDSTNSCITSIEGADDGIGKNATPQEKPKSVLSSDRIVLTTRSLLPGKYLMLVQKWDGMKCLSRFIPIIYKEGSPLKINIPLDAKLPFRLDLGVVDLRLE
jgi:hypothetical protein